MLILFDRFPWCGVNAFTECQKFVPFRNYDFSIVILGGIFDTTSFGYENLNIDTQTFA